jgi:hypothetical protein
MLRRLLNIAFVVCLVECVALMGMWVRSYRYYDVAGGLIFPNQSLGINSLPGKLLFTQGPTDPKRGKRSVVSEGSEPAAPSKESPWFLFSRKYPQPQPSGGWRPFYVFLFPDARTNWVLQLSYWLLVLVSGSLAIFLKPRWPWRFNLRTLFIATTLLAVVLGMIAWLDRAWIGK